MHSKLKWWWDDQDMIFRFEGKVDMNEVMNLKLDELDRRVIFDPIDKGSDFLLAMEVLFRRLEE